MAATGLFSILIGIFMIGVLIGKPMTVKRADELCLSQASLGSQMRLLMNCDSFGFMALAKNPATLMEVGENRQSRPAFVVLGAAVGRMFVPVAAVLRPMLPGRPISEVHTAEQVESEISTLLPYFMGYIFLNVILLCITFYAVFDANLTADGIALSLMLPVLAALSLFISNDVVKAFIWSPHTQFFNILFPVLGSLLIANRTVHSSKTMVLFGTSIGVGILAYGSAAVLLVCLLIGDLLACREAGHPFITARSLASAAVAVCFAILPSVMWYAYVTIEIGRFHSAEVEKYKQIVWIYYAWQQGWAVLFAQIWSKLVFFTTAFLRQSIPPVVAITVAAAWVAANSRNPRAWFKGMVGPALTAISVSALFLVFFTVVGWEEPRLAYSGVGPLIVLLCTGIVRAQKAFPGGWSWGASMVAGLAAASFMIYVIAKDGPYS